MPQIQARLVDRVIAGIEHLPTLPQVVTKILEMTNSESVNAADLSKQLDQSTSARVLKMANSAYYGTRVSGRVNTIHHAIVIIGFDAIKEIILTTSLFHTFKDFQDLKSLQPLWRHSLQTALITKRLAWVYRYEAMEEAYLAGLIHDIGKLIIQQYFRDEFRTPESWKGGVYEGLDVEKEILGMTHAQIGGMLCTHWNFPKTIVEAVSHHHDEEWQLNPKLGRMLSYANRFVLGMIDFQTMLELFRQSGMIYPTSWNSEELLRVRESFQKELNKASSMFGFQ